MTATPLRCAVLVPRLGNHDHPCDFHVIWANGDEAEARKIASAWVTENPGHEAHIFIRDDTARAVTKIEWTKP